MFNGKIPTPICFKCRKPVEKISHYRNHKTIREVYVAECHGEKEEVVFDLSFLGTVFSFSPGYAFVTKGIVNNNNIQRKTLKSVNVN